LVLSDLVEKLSLEKEDLAVKNQLQETLIEKQNIAELNLKEE
jgi:hypothetical protein